MQRFSTEQLWLEWAARALGLERLLCLSAADQLGLPGVPTKTLHWNNLERNFFSNYLERHHRCKGITYSSALSWGGRSTGHGAVWLGERKAPNTLWFLLPQISHSLDGYLFLLCQGTGNSAILSTCSDLSCGLVSYCGIKWQRAVFHFMVTQRQKGMEKLYGKRLRSL